MLISKAIAIKNSCYNIGEIMEYSTRKQVRIIDFDKAGHVKISSLLSIMQEAADEQTKKIALNNIAMMEGGQAWILTRQAVKIYKNNGYNGELTVTTGALPSKTIEFPREYRLTTLSGETVAYSVGYWSVINVGERRLVRATDVPCYSELLLDKDCADIKFAKLRDTDIKYDEPIALHIVANCEIDLLGHLNNTFYPDMVYNALDKVEFDKETAEFNITYVNEAKLGEKIFLYKTVGDGKVYVTGKLENNNTCFIAEIKFK